jgi:RNA polymerase sigma-70 factor (ECF subfamily)
MADETNAVGHGGAMPTAASAAGDSAPTGIGLGCSSPIGLDLPRLVADHAEVLYRYAYRLTGSDADAEDLTQQTFLIAHQKLTQLREAAGARGWLFTVLRNVYLKNQKDGQRLPIAGGSFDIEGVPDDVVDALIVDRELLQSALDELPDGYKLVVLCFYFEDLSYREIAERLELPVGTVMSRLSRAKNLLRSRLLEPECAAAADRPALAPRPQGDA